MGLIAFGIGGFIFSAIVLAVSAYSASFTTRDIRK